MLIGKSELARQLGWARTRLDRRLKSDPNFPCVCRGDQGGGWEFRLSDVIRHLDGEPAAETIDQVSPVAGSSPAPQLSNAGAVSAPAPRGHAAARTAHHAGEASARQRRELADAMLAEDKLRKQRAELVDREEMRTALRLVVASFNTDLDKLPDLLVMQCALPADAAPVIATLVGKVRSQLDRNAAPLLGDQRHVG